MEKFPTPSLNGGENPDYRQLLSQRLREIYTEVAPDYEITDALWAQMVSALTNGSKAAGGPFTLEELEAFDDRTRARLGDFLAEATRGMVPGKGALMADSRGEVLGAVESKPDAMRRAQEERDA